MSAPTVYTVDEAAAATGMSGDQLRAAIRHGDVPAEYRGQRYLLTRETVEHLRGERPAQTTGGAHMPNDTDTNNVNKLADTWAPGRRGLTEAEIVEFTSLWNDDLAHLGRSGLEARGFAVITERHALHLDWRLDDDRSCLVTIRSTDEAWSPAPIMCPRAASKLLEIFAERFQELEHMVKNGADRNDIALRAWKSKDAAVGARVVADEAADDLLEIPDGAQLDGVALVYERTDESEAVA